MTLHCKKHIFGNSKIQNAHLLLWQQNSPYFHANWCKQALLYSSRYYAAQLYQIRTSFCQHDQNLRLGCLLPPRMWFRACINAGVVCKEARSVGGTHGSPSSRHQLCNLSWQPHMVVGLVLLNRKGCLVRVKALAASHDTSESHHINGNEKCTNMHPCIAMTSGRNIGLWWCHTYQGTVVQSVLRW